MKNFLFILAAMLASGTSFSTFAESGRASDSRHAPAAGGTPSTADQTDPGSAQPSPHAASLTSGIAGSVLGVDPHTHVITIKTDHAVDGIHSGERITVYKGSGPHRIARHRRHGGASESTAAAHNRPMKQQRPPIASVNQPSAVSSPRPQPPAAGTAVPGTGENLPPENTGTATATLAPSAPAPAAPTTGSNASQTATPDATGMPSELGMIPRRSGGYGTGGTTPGGL